MEERGRAADKLLASEELFRQLAENIDNVFFVASPDLAQIFYMSPGFARVGKEYRLGGAVRSQSARSGTSGGSPTSRIQIAANRAVLPGARATGVSHFASGRVDALATHADLPILDDSGVVRAVGVTTDITERKLAEIRIVRLNRTYSVLSGINSLIVRATDRDTLLRDACRLAVERGGFGVAWCGLLDEETNTLRRTAFAGDANELAPTVSFTLTKRQPKTAR